MEALLNPLSMRPTILEPKLTPPVPRGHQVAREALLDKLGQTAMERLVLVCAPAGFGKTTTLQQWRSRLADQGIATAWLALDAQDNDRSRFLAGLQAALERLADGTGSSIPASSPGEWALDLIDRFAALQSPFVLFLDDVESVHDAGVLSLLGQLIDRLPRNGRLVLGTRTRPALPLARLRMLGQLVEVDAEHLRFSLAETTRFFAASQVALPGELLRRLHDKSEGWAAALRLASLALDRPHASADLIERFSGSNLALVDYLAEDVLSGLEPQMRLFLLHTSVLKHLSPGLCQAICDDTLPGVDATAMLEQLAAANLFITPVPSEAGAYRYHALFSDFLRGQLKRSGDPGEQKLHRIAARWYENQRRPVPAIDHALEGLDFDGALRLLDASALPLLMEGRLRLLARWLGEIPAELLPMHERVHVIGLWSLCLTSGPIDVMARLASSNLRDCTEPVARGLVDALETTLLAVSDRHDEAYARAGPLLTRLSQADPGSGSPGDSFADSVLVNAIANAAIVRGRYQEARHLLDAGRRAQGRAPSAFSLMYAEATDGILDLLEGRLRQATARFRLAVQSTTGSAHASSHAGGNAWAGLLYAATVYEAGELGHAEQLLNVYLPMVCEAGLPDHMMLGHLMLARIASNTPGTLPDNARASQILTDLEALGHKRNLARVVAGARLERARLAMHQGDGVGVDLELSRANDAALWERVAQECHLANDLESLPLSLLRRALLLGDAAAVATAIPRIEHEIALATAASSHRRVLLLRLLQAIATLRMGNVNAALAQFQLVLKVCAREGFVRLLVDEGPLAGELLQRFLAQDSDLLRRDPLLADHARRALQAFGPLPNPADHAPPTERLTPQELRVLQGVAEGLSNDEVAERWNVSRSTVRTHMRNISVKLGAQNRTQAVSVARRLGWLA